MGAKDVVIILLSMADGIARLIKELSKDFPEYKEIARQCDVLVDSLNERVRRDEEIENQIIGKCSKS